MFVIRIKLINFRCQVLYEIIYISYRFRPFVTVLIRHIEAELFRFFSKGSSS